MFDPIVSMYGIFTYIYHKNQPNVGIYTIHGSYGALTAGVAFGCVKLHRFLKQLEAKMRAMLTEELLRLGTAQARAAEEQAHHRP